MARQQLGSVVFGACALALGVLGLVRGDFTVVWHPVPEELPARTALAYVAALLFIAGGLGIQVERFRTACGTLLAVLFAVLGTQWLIRIFNYPDLIGTWLGYSEQLALALGGVMVALLPLGPGKRTVAMCRIAFGIFQLVFGLAHFLSLPETVTMTPSWLPPDRTFWALATGAIHFVGGLAFIFGLWPRVVAATLAAMFTSFALLVWLPAFAANPGAPVPLPGVIVTMALTGAMLALYDLLGASIGSDGISHSGARSTTGNEEFNVSA